MEESFAMGMKNVHMRGPLLHDGMVSFLQWLDEKGHITPQRIYDLCTRTAGDHDTVYKRKVSKDDWLEISHRSHPKGPSKGMILSAIIFGEGWTIGHGLLDIERRMLPESCLHKIAGEETLTKGHDVLNHPYLKGTWLKRPQIKKDKILLTVMRAKPQYVLTQEGIVKK